MAKTAVTLTNDQILGYINYSNSANFWQRKNEKISGKLSWITRMNKKAIEKAFELIQEAEQEINDSYKDKTVTETDENGNKLEMVAPEYQQEFIDKKVELFSQTQDIDLELINPEELFDYNLSDDDWDLIAFMLKDDPSAEAEYNEQEAAKIEEAK